MVKDLTTGSPAKLILMFTLPLIVGNVFQQLYLLSDTLIVGRLLGVSALAAVGCSGCLMFFMIGFVIGFTTGLSICTGQRFGARDEIGMRQSAAACTVLSILFTIIITAIGVMMVRPVLIFLQTPPEVLDMACTFLTVIYMGIGATMMFNVSSNLIRALGDSSTPLYFLILGCVLNIILEVLFIAVFDWGIKGAGFATVMAQLINGSCCVYYIKKKIPLLHFSRSDLKISRSVAWQHLRVALPMGFQASIIAIGAIILQVPLNNLGEVAVAAYAAAQKIDMIAVMPLMSFGMAMAAYTAQNYGAGRIDRIKSGVNKCILMSGSFSIFIGIFNVLMGPQLVRLFVGAGQEQVVSYGHTYLIVNGSCYLILSLLFIYRFTLQGLGQSVVPTFAGIMELVMRAAAGLFLVDMFGYIGACWANPMAWIGSCVPLMITFYMTRKSLLKRYADDSLSGMEKL